MNQQITPESLDQLFKNDPTTKQHIIDLFGEPASSKKDKNLASRTFLYTELSYKSDELGKVLFKIDEKNKLIKWTSDVCPF